MKIWIITSGTETLTLFKFLSSYDHDYVIYYDFFHRPYGDKTFDQAFACIQKGIDYLIGQGVDRIILPPIYELRIFNTPWSVDKLHFDKILFLFKMYLLEYCFTYSLIGKIGLLGDYADLEKAQISMKEMEKKYILSNNQKTIKKFHSPFAYWVKETPLRKYYLTNLSYSNILINKIIKFDLRYFKDAMVDTIIPLNYWYFHYQTTITKFLNFKKIRFHGLEKLDNCFQQLAWNVHAKTWKSYSVQIICTWNSELLRREKRLMRLLQRGKTIEIDRKKI